MATRGVTESHLQTHHVDAGECWRLVCRRTKDVHADCVFSRESVSHREDLDVVLPCGPRQCGILRGVDVVGVDDVALGVYARSTCGYAVRSAPVATGYALPLGQTSATTT